MDINYAHKLHDLRIGARLTQQATANLLGYNHGQHVGRIEAGTRYPDPRAIRLIRLWDCHGLEALKGIQP